MNIIEIALVALMVGIVIWMAWHEYRLDRLERRTKDTFSRVQGIIKKERAKKRYQRYYRKCLPCKTVTVQTHSLPLYYTDTRTMTGCIFVDAWPGKASR